MKFILAKKIEMTQIWKGGRVVPVTKVQAGPCVVVQIKNGENDGYASVQLGFGSRKEKNISKPQKGHTKKLGNFRYLREFRLDKASKKESVPELKIGEIIGAETFAEGDIIKVVGMSKGRGFQGVVRRHGFHGHNATHGTKDQVRMPGSIGATGPAHVFKGMRMPGQMGDARITVANLTIAKVEPENNTIYIRGAVPGARNGLLLVSGSGELTVKQTVEAIAEPEEAPLEKIDDMKKETPENIQQEKEETNNESSQANAEKIVEN
jgi:large subunit ribosomal protein L3